MLSLHQDENVIILAVVYWAGLRKILSMGPGTHHPVCYLMPSFLVLKTVEINSLCWLEGVTSTNNILIVYYMLGTIKCFIFFKGEIHITTI